MRGHPGFLVPDAAASDPVGEPGQVQLCRLVLEGLGGKVKLQWLENLLGFYFTEIQGGPISHF